MAHGRTSSCSRGKGFPAVLIFDTASYDVQDGLFKRLAYFVEKAGYRGEIEDPAALAGKHGYNAHDYRAEDLARFFSEAARQGDALTPGEAELEQILLSNDLIRKTAAGFSPGRGSRDLDLPQLGACPPPPASLPRERPR